MAVKNRPIKKKLNSEMTWQMENIVLRKSERKLSQVTVAGRMSERAAVHSQRVECRFESLAGRLEEIRIRRWTCSSQQCSLVIPISCVGVYL